DVEHEAAEAGVRRDRPDLHTRPWPPVPVGQGDLTVLHSDDAVRGKRPPALLRLYAIMTLTAPLLSDKGATWGRRPAWYGKTRPTFSDAMALVRHHVWEHSHFSTSTQ